MKIAVFYHCIIRGPRILNEDGAIGILSEQMTALKFSGLAKAADEIHIGVNGSDSDALTVSAFLPPKSVIHVNSGGESELATMNIMQQWAKPGWMVLYHHMKGAQAPDHALWTNWRRCMELACVWNWNFCVEALEQGADTAGAHWMTSSRYPIIHPSQRYWGGNFFWSTSEHLLRLPALPADSFAARYEAESWIGKSRTHPKVKDFAPHFPMKCPAL